MKWLVTGATGLIGAALTRRLSARGDEVVAAVRDEAKARRLLGGLPGVSFVAWNVTRPFAGVADDAPEPAARRAASHRWREK